MTLRDRYPEMGMDDDDPRLEQLMSDLDQMGRASRASTLQSQDDMWIVHALQGRAAARGSNETTVNRTRFILHRHRPLAFTAAVALSILMVMGATYAAVPVLTRVFDPRCKHSRGCLPPERSDLLPRYTRLASEIRGCRSFERMVRSHSTSRSPSSGAER